VVSDFDALLERHSPDVRAIFLALRDLVRDVMPDTTEQLDLPDHLVAFGFGPAGGTRLRDLAVALIPHTGHVNVQLADGALLDDPTGIVEGTGKRIRHVKCRSLDAVARPDLRSLLGEQAARRRPPSL
jgi:hypothetical protein